MNPNDQTGEDCKREHPLCLTVRVYKFFKTRFADLMDYQWIWRTITAVALFIVFLRAYGVNSFGLLSIAIIACLGAIFNLIFITLDVPVFIAMCILWLLLSTTSLIDLFLYPSVLLKKDNSMVLVINVVNAIAIFTVVALVR